jgi:hypothetical protein
MNNFSAIILRRMGQWDGNSRSHFYECGVFHWRLVPFVVVQPDLTLTELENQCFPIVAGLYRALSVR